MCNEFFHFFWSGRDSKWGAGKHRGKLSRFSIRPSIHPLIQIKVGGLVFLDKTLKRNDTKKKLQFICFWTEVLYFIQNSLASTELHLFREVMKPSCWFSKCAVVFDIRQLGHTNFTQITAIKNMLLFFSASK